MTQATIDARIKNCTETLASRPPGDPRLGSDGWKLVLLDLERDIIIYRDEQTRLLWAAQVDWRTRHRWANQVGIKLPFRARSWTHDSAERFCKKVTETTTPALPAFSLPSFAQIERADSNGAYKVRIFTEDSNYWTSELDKNYEGRRSDAYIIWRNTFGRQRSTHGAHGLAVCVGRPPDANDPDADGSGSVSPSPGRTPRGCGCETASDPSPTDALLFMASILLLLTRRTRSSRNVQKFEHPDSTLNSAWSP